jgi:hypothetical protein
VLLAPRWCSGGGSDEGATVVASKRSRHGGSDGGGNNDGVPMVVVCAPIASLIAVRRWQRARETTFFELIQAERRVMDL